MKFLKATGIPAADKLKGFKKLVELQNKQAKTLAAECREEIETNQETIRKLRNEISEARILIKSAKANECLMRQALRDHHSGNSIFLEREPRDVNTNVDYKLSDLQNKLNKLRHTHRIKEKYVENLLNTFNETVNDTILLELEGPMGDALCLTIDNQICASGKKYMAAEMIGHTYRHTRDHLFAEGISSQSSLYAANKRLQCHEKELLMCEQLETDAVREKEKADAEVLKTELDLYNIREDRKIEVVDFKKKTEQEKQEYATLWKTIQAHFAAQESMPPSHMRFHSRLSISSGTDLHDPCDLFEHGEEELELLKNVTGSHTVPEVAEKFEEQESTCQQTKSFVSELEVRKAALLQRLEALNTIHSSLLYRRETEQDAKLRTASGDSKAAHHGRWSRLAASSRVTQTLARLRQLLEYLQTVFVDAGLIQPPPARDASGTAAHLRALLVTTSAGAAALMASVEPARGERSAAAAAAAALLMTPSERHVQRCRAQLERNTAGDEFGYVGTDGDTTGDDAVPSRADIKRQAHLILMTRQKSGCRGRKK